MEFHLEPMGAGGISHIALFEQKRRFFPPVRPDRLQRRASTPDAPAHGLTRKHTRSHTKPTPRWQRTDAAPRANSHGSNAEKFLFPQVKNHVRVWLMTLILSHGTALEYWRASRAAAAARTDPGADAAVRAKPTRADVLARATADEGEIAAALQSCGVDLALPLHVLVPRTEKRPANAFVRRHSATELPGGALVRIGAGLFVASPELCLLQLSLSMPLVDVVKTGYELCGSYTVHRGTLYRCAPATTPRRLAAFVERSAGANGVKRLRRALAYILPNSASPAETILSMALSLPYRLGGYSLPAPQLNVRIDPGAKARRLVSQSYYVCDLYWQESGIGIPHRGAQNSQRLPAARRPQDPRHRRQDGDVRPASQRSQVRPPGLRTRQGHGLSRTASQRAVRAAQARPAQDAYGSAADG